MSIILYDDGNGNVLYYSTNDVDNIKTLGTIDYQTGVVTITNTEDIEYNAIEVVGALTGIDNENNKQNAKKAIFLVPSPVQIGSFQIIANGVVVNANKDGTISGNGITGTIDYQTGLCSIESDTDMRDISYNSIQIIRIPVDENIFGLNPMRLPIDGKVPIFRKGDVVIIHNTAEIVQNVSEGDSVTIQNDVDYVDVFDANGNKVDETAYTINGTTLTFNADLTGYEQPFTISMRKEDMSLAEDVKEDGTIKLKTALKRTYDTTNTYVSSALLLGDIGARVENVFDQKNWVGKWTDILEGGGCDANYNIVKYPIEVTNKGTINERWALLFTDSERFVVIGEDVGQIAEGDIHSDTAPLNPATQTPYFIVRAGGWGSGWQANNVLRFNTIPAYAPVWFARSVAVGDSNVGEDKYKIQIRGDSD